MTTETAFEIVGWLALALNVWGNLALTKKNIWGWVIRLACNVTWIVYASAVGAWPLLGNHAAFMVINAIGWYRWKRDIGGGKVDGLIVAETSAAMWRYHLRELAEGEEPKTSGYRKPTVALCGTGLGWDITPTGSSSVAYFMANPEPGRLYHPCAECHRIASKRA